MTQNPAENAAADVLSRIRVVLVATTHPGNIGAAARAMLTMGLTRLVLVAPKSFPDDQARARAAGADAVLDSARVVTTLEEAIADCSWVVATSARPRHLGDEPSDLFGVGQKVVVDGHWDGQTFESGQILLKHSEEYVEENPDRLDYDVTPTTSAA